MDKIFQFLLSPLGKIIVISTWEIFWALMLWHLLSSKKITWWNEEIALSSGEKITFDEATVVELLSDDSFKLDSANQTINSSHVAGPVSSHPGFEIWTGTINVGVYQVKKACNLHVYYAVRPKGKLTPSLYSRIQSVIAMAIVLGVPLWLYLLMKFVYNR